MDILILILFLLSQKPKECPTAPPPRSISFSKRITGLDHWPPKDFWVCWHPLDHLALKQLKLFRCLQQRRAETSFQYSLSDATNHQKTCNELRTIWFKLWRAKCAGKKITDLLDAPVYQWVRIMQIIICKVELLKDKAKLPEFKTQSVLMIKRN